MNFYVHQDPGFALGNFINLTPTIRELYEKHAQRIPVFFGTEYVRQCYIECEFIEIIDEPRGDLLMSSNMINKRNDKPDIVFIAEKIIGSMARFQPFIDQPKPFNNSEYGVFINGAGSENPEYLERKLIPESVQMAVKENSKIPVYGTGSLKDLNRNVFQGYFGNIRDSLALINGASWVITNATGMYHAAGAMEKKQLALWKQCRRPRNENLNENSIIAMPNQWNNQIINFLK